MLTADHWLNVQTEDPVATKQLHNLFATDSCSFISPKHTVSMVTIACNESHINMPTYPVVSVQVSEHFDDFVVTENTSPWRVNVQYGP